MIPQAGISTCSFEVGEGIGQGNVEFTLDAASRSHALVETAGVSVQISKNCMLRIRT